MNIKNLFEQPSPLVMGILNVTPDSFSDGGHFNTVKTAIEHAKEMIKDGVDIIDIGGQSTRPGYKEVSPEMELDRLLPVIKGIRDISDIPISVDTYFPQVAEKMIELGVNIINDIKGGDSDGMLDVIQDHPTIGYIYMHSRPVTLGKLEKELLAYQDEMLNEFNKRGIDINRTSFDPGVGWKSHQEHLEIMTHPSRYCYFDRGPVLYGLSRKRTIATLINQDDPLKRDTASTVAHLIAIDRGVKIVRVHDVRGMVDALAIYNALQPS